LREGVDCHFLRAAWGGCLKRLIVTAMNFGAAREVNDDVEAAHRGGILHRGKLDVAAPCADDAVARARRILRCASACIWCWWRGGRASAGKVPHLVDGTGAFRRYGALGTSCSSTGLCAPRARGRVTAQFEAFRATGLTLDHCNAHKHFHLHPVIERLMVRLAALRLARSASTPEPGHVLSKDRTEGATDTTRG